MITITLDGDTQAIIEAIALKHGWKPTVQSPSLVDGRPTSKEIDNPQSQEDKFIEVVRNFIFHEALNYNKTIAVEAAAKAAEDASKETVLEVALKTGE